MELKQICNGTMTTDGTKELCNNEDLACPLNTFKHEDKEYCGVCLLSMLISVKGGYI